MLEETPLVLEEILVVPGEGFVELEGTLVEVEESVPPVLVKVAERQSVVTDRSETENAYEVVSKWKMATS